jgi:hypothetical protein
VRSRAQAMPSKGPSAAWRESLATREARPESVGCGW